MDLIEKFVENKTILITGGTGSFGNAFVNKILNISKTTKILIYSRDEYKQYLMAQKYPTMIKEGMLRFIVGDVRNKEKLISACRGVDYIVHAAALKQVPVCENNIEEAVLTNINGAFNVKNAAEVCRVKKVVALSTDKAVQPINLYGATKMVSDKVFTDISELSNTVYSIVRYGNVATSRGSVIPFFKEIFKTGAHEYPITDEKMTRFWIDLDNAVNMALTAMMNSYGGETFVAKLPSFYIVDLVKALDPNGKINIVGVRPGEKIDEVMITKQDANKTIDFAKYYVIYPNTEAALKSGKRFVHIDFEYSSNKNNQWLDVETIKKLL